MKKKASILTLLSIIAMGLLWWSMPAWMSLPTQSTWTMPLTSGTSNPQPLATSTKIFGPFPPMESKLDDLEATAKNLPTDGELTFLIRDKIQGKENYSFTILENGFIEALAKGVLQFEIAFIPIEVKYRQVIQWTEDFVPVQYIFELRGPLGIGNRTTRINFGPSQAVMVSNRKETIIPLPANDRLAINMFAAFDLLTQWFKVGQKEASFLALDAGGLDASENLGPQGYLLGKMQLILNDDILVQSGQVQKPLTRYVIHIDGPQNGFELFYDQGQWVGVRGKSSDDGGGFFTVYRNDLFPDGFNLLSDNLLQ